jgi:predicted ATP-binding protein involved in virulence
MRIDRLKLQNFRCFSQYEIDLAPRFTLLVGDNGTGKTALLDALAVAAGSFFLGVSVEGVEARDILRDDVRQRNLWVGQTLTSEEEGPTVVAAEGIVDGGSLDWSRSLTSRGSQTTIHLATPIQIAARKLVEQVQAGEGVILPVIAYFGSGRLFPTKRDQTISVGSPESRLTGYLQCLNPASDPTRLFRWFKTNELAALQKGETRHVLEAVRTAILSLVPGTRRVYWDVDWDELVIVTEDTSSDRTTPFHLMSDGYRNLVALAADIVYRMATLNPHLLAGAARETPGIVLIDEVDLHLHPNWQRIVVDSLLRTFPRVQFVGTTHSPFIIQTLHGRPESMLWDLNTDSPLPVETKSIEDIAEENQGVKIPQQSHRFLEMMRVAEEYYGLLRQSSDADPKRREELKDELDRLALPYSDEPAYQAFLNQQRIAAGMNGRSES